MPFFTRMDVLLLSYTNPESIIKLPVPNGRAFFCNGFHLVWIPYLSENATNTACQICQIL